MHARCPGLVGRIERARYLKLAADPKNEVREVQAVHKGELFGQREDDKRREAAEDRIAKKSTTPT